MTSIVLSQKYLLAWSKFVFQITFLCHLQVHMLLNKNEQPLSLLIATCVLLKPWKSSIKINITTFSPWQYYQMKNKHIGYS